MSVPSCFLGCGTCTEQEGKGLRGLQPPLQPGGFIGPRWPWKCILRVQPTVLFQLGITPWLCLPLLWQLHLYSRD